MMGGKSKRPKPPPPAPTPVDEQAVEASEREKRRLSRRGGRLSTILTGGQGVGDQNVASRRLLGE